VLKRTPIPILLLVLFLCGDGLFGAECPTDPPPVEEGLYNILVKAQVLMDQGKDHEALDLLDRYAKENPPENHPHLAFTRGLLNYRIERLETAEALFTKAVQLYPCFGEAWQNLGIVRYARKRPAEAAEAMEKAFALLHPERPELTYQTALFYTRAGQPEKALPLLEKLVAKTPLPAGSANGFFLLAMTYDQLGQPEKAAAALDRADLKDPAVSTDLRIQAAFFWMRRDRPERALPLLKEAAKCPRPSRMCRVALVKALVMTGSARQAEPVLRNLLNEGPGDVELWRLASWAAIHQKEYSRAAAALEVTYRLDPPEAGEWRRLGDLYRLAGVPLKAAEAYQRVFGPDPGAKDLDLLTDTYLQGHALREAIAAAGHAVQKDPSARRWERLGDIHLKAWEYGKAMDAFQQSARIDDTGGRMSLKAGYAAWKAEQMAPAKEAFQTALRRAGSEDKTAVRAAQALAAIRQIMERPHTSRLAPPKPY